MTRTNTSRRAGTGQEGTGQREGAESTLHSELEEEPGRSTKEKERNPRFVLDLKKSLEMSTKK